MKRGSPRIIRCREPQAGDEGLWVGDWTLTSTDIPFSSSSDPIYSELPKSNLMSTLSEAPSSCPPPPPSPIHSTPLLIQPLYSLSMKPRLPPRLHPPLSTTCQGRSNRRAGWEWWARSEKPPGWLAHAAQQDGYAGCLLLTIAGEAKWMSAGFHLTGNLRNVREVTVNELFWICLVISFFPLSDQRFLSFFFSLFWQMWWNDWKWMFVWLRLTH